MGARPTGAPVSSRAALGTEPSVQGARARSNEAGGQRAHASADTARMPQGRTVDDVDHDGLDLAPPAGGVVAEVLCKALGVDPVPVAALLVVVGRPVRRLALLGRRQLAEALVAEHALELDLAFGHAQRRQLVRRDERRRHEAERDEDRLGLVLLRAERPCSSLFCRRHVAALTAHCAAARQPAPPALRARRSSSMSAVLPPAGGRRAQERQDDLVAGLAVEDARADEDRRRHARRVERRERPAERDLAVVEFGQDGVPGE